MKKIILSFVILSFMLVAFSCNKHSENELPTPQTEQTMGRNSDFTSIVVPEYLLSKTGVVDTVFIKNFTISHPNTPTYQGKAKIKADALGDIVSLELDNDFMNDTNIGVDVLVNESSCADRVKSALTKCRGNCARVVDPGECRLDCAVTAFLAGVYDGTIGWFAGCYYN